MNNLPIGFPPHTPVNITPIPKGNDPIPLPPPVPPIGKPITPNLRKVNRNELSEVTGGSQMEQIVGQGVDATHASDGVLPQIANPEALLPVHVPRQGRNMVKPAWRKRLDTYQILEQQLARREPEAQMGRG